MTSPHAQATSSASSRSSAPKVFQALAIAFISVLLMSCQYPSNSDQPTYSPYQQPAYAQKATAQGQRYTATPSYGQPTYPYGQAPSTYSVSNNPITNRAQAWAQRAESRKPVYPTSNGSRGTRGKRRLPNATTGVFGLPPQQLPANYGQTAPVAQQYAPTPQPRTAPNWQGAPTYTQQQPSAAGYGPGTPSPGAGYSNVGYTPYPGGGTSDYGAPSAASGSRYTIQKGDSLSAIARSQGVPLGTLMQVNGLSINSVIHPDQTLIIPGR